MSTKTENSRDPATHSANIQRQLDELIQHTREDVAKVEDPKFQALLETSAEVLGGLKTAFRHFDEKNEAAWR